MQLTRFSDYSVRVLIYLGVHGNQPATIRNIAEAYGISRTHLMKVVNRLTKVGYVRAIRGPGGGLTLGAPPKEIVIGEVVRQCGEDLALVECWRPDNQCVITPACSLKDVLAEALSAFLSVLDNVTLYELIRPKDKIKPLLFST